MNNRSLEKTYDSTSVEDAIYAEWESSGYFNPDNLPHAKEPYSIAMPPPNATGMLHLGHASMLVIQDVLIRFHRMLGRKTLWLPGTDHASIATQNKVEKLLAKEGKTRQELGREAFLEQVAAYVAESRGTIRNQIKKMGASCDWSRERYTLDEGLSRSVSTAFVRMYEEGLIYRDYRMVNWCPRCTSTLADDEVEHEPQAGTLYTINYPVRNSSDSIPVATTRPETLLGDTAIAVNPDDPRYAWAIGSTAVLPLVGREIPIIADEYVEKEFGTGALKVTPAHDPNDFALGKKYHLPTVKVLDEIGRISLDELRAGGFDLSILKGLEGMDRFEARSAITDLLSDHGYLKKTEDIHHAVGTCYRCDTVIEPSISLQWFIDVNRPVPSLDNKTLKDVSIDTVATGATRIIPKRFEKLYYHWVNNLRDWCISRQIWFGHQLPVYYCRSEEGGCGETIVSVEMPRICPACKNADLVRDTDTLDTWFSSGLWTFSTLGWPDTVETKHGKVVKKGELQTYHPTSVLETGYDILTFWVARMILMSRYFMHEEPFTDVYLHGLVLDKNGKKMSKSKEETAIDPLAMIEKYGADALRLSMLVGVTPGSDVRLYEEKIASYRNFINKLWNISRFILEFGISDESAHAKHLTLSDRWIISRMNRAIADVTRMITHYQLSQAAETLRVFTWDELADWYLEIAKIEKGKQETLARILETLLALWHPFTPFVTEYLFKNIAASDKKHAANLLMIHSWPQTHAKEVSQADEERFAALQGAIQAIRNARAEHGIPPSQKIQAYYIPSAHAKSLISENASVIKGLARLDIFEAVHNGERPEHALYIKTECMEIYLPLGMMKIEEERARLAKEAENFTRHIAAIKGRLENQEFAQRAPKHIIEKEREKLADYETGLLKTNEQLEKLS